MSIFVDTSALLAILDADDKKHPPAREIWIHLLTGGEDLVCTNYVLLETFALVQRRLGLAAVRCFQGDIVPVLRIEWVDADLHRAATAALLVAGRRKLSLVDCVSFEMMRRSGIREAFAFDKHFIKQGFRCRP